MGRRKGSKNKPKVVQHELLQSTTPIISRSPIPNAGVSILDIEDVIVPRMIPTIVYNINATRTKGIEKRLESLINRHKSFYLQCSDILMYSNYFVDSGGWAWAEDNDKYSILIGHVKNLLPFMGGPHPVWEQKRSYTRHKVKRGMHLG